MDFAPADLQRLHTLLEQSHGGSPDAGRAVPTKATVVARMKARNVASLDQYTELLAKEPKELAALATLLTVGETYFFRSAQHYTVLREVVLPEMRAAGTTSFRALSAGCATGEEPYSIAMVLEEERAEGRPWNVAIEGVDLNPEALEKARAGVYTDWSLRALDEVRKQRFFTQSAKQWKLREAVKKNVSFRAGNLVAMHEIGGEFDVIFCRNVLIYFSHEGIVRAIDGLCRLLRPGGYLFLGPAETLRGVSRSFALCHTHDTFYYRHPEKGGAVKGQPPVAAPSVMENVPAMGVDTEWFDAIQRSMERVAAMSSSRKKTKSAVAGVVVNPMEKLLALAAQERHAEALEEFLGLPEEIRSSEPGQVVHASLLAQMGRRKEAEQLCRGVLAQNAMSAEAHYVLAMTVDPANVSQTMEHAETAAYLDEGFAMAQLQAGLLYLKKRDKERAKKALERAVRAFAHEDARRITLFGGGFSREGLRSVCEAELKKLKARM